MFIKELEVKYSTRPEMGEVEMVEVSSPEAVYEFIRPLIVNETREKTIGVYVNNKNEVTGYEIISIGTVNESILHPREIFIPALLTNSTGVILIHNHPSLCLEPSKEDIQTTKRVVAAGNILGISLIDHLIVSTNSYKSLREDMPNLFDK